MRASNPFVSNDLLGRPLRRFERTNKRATIFASDSELYPQSRVVYGVVRLREDSWRPLRRFERTNKRATSFASDSELYPQSRVVYRVVRLREDSFQLPRPNPDSGATAGSSSSSYSWLEQAKCASCEACGKGSDTV